MRLGRFFFFLSEVCYEPLPIIPPQLTTAPAEWLLLPYSFYSAFTLCECCIVHSPLLMVLFSAEQQGSINERPLTIRSQLWLSEHSTVCSFNTQPHLPDNCVIRVCINNWSPNRDMFYVPVCLICQIEVTVLLMTDWSSDISELELQKASYCPLEISYLTNVFGFCHL